MINRKLDRRHPAFLWMTSEAAFAGLFLNNRPLAWKWDELKTSHGVRESLTGVWKLFEYLPFKQLSYNDDAEQTFR